MKKINFDGILYVTKPQIDEATSVVLLAIKNLAEKKKYILSASIEQFSKESSLLIIAIGGDGTMLGAMRTALQFPNSIVYGINTGTLGFLSEEIAIKDIETAVDNITRRNGIIDERMALKGTITINDELVSDNLIAVNDMAMVPMTLQRPVTISVGINNQKVSDIKGSGVVVATSTGSTAMALSGGGAIISPSTNVMQIVPIMAHTLSSRPIITTGRDCIVLSAKLQQPYHTIEVYGDGNELATATSDVDSTISLRIRKHENKIKVYRPPNWNFFNVLSEKMKW